MRKTDRSVPVRFAHAVVSDINEDQSEVFTGTPDSSNHFNFWTIITPQTLGHQ